MHCILEKRPASIKGLWFHYKKLEEATILRFKPLIPVLHPYPQCRKKLFALLLVALKITSIFSVFGGVSPVETHRIIENHSSHLEEATLWWALFHRPGESNDSHMRIFVPLNLVHGLQCSIFYAGASVPFGGCVMLLWISFLRRFQSQVGTAFL